MNELKSMLTEENVKNLEMARLTYQGRMRDYINRRAEELVKFAKMQSSVIVQPNQQEMQAQVQKLQALDFEIKRLSDCIMAATVLISSHSIPAMFDNLKNIRDQVALAISTICDVNKDLQQTKVEEVFAVSIVRDYAQYASALYPTTNIFEQASFLAYQKSQEENGEQQQAADAGKGVDGLTGSLLVSI